MVDLKNGITTNRPPLQAISLPALNLPRSVHDIAPPLPPAATRPSLQYFRLGEAILNDDVTSKRGFLLCPNTQEETTIADNGVKESNAEMQSNILMLLSKLSEDVGTLLVASQTVDNISECVAYLGTLPEEVAKLQDGMNLVLQQRCNHNQDDYVDNSKSVDSPGRDSPSKLLSEASKSKFTTHPPNSKDTRSCLKSLKAKGSFESRDTSGEVLPQKQPLDTKMNIEDSSFDSMSRKKREEREDKHVRQSKNATTPSFPERGRGYSNMFGNHSDTQALDEKEYDVRDFYHYDGTIARIARSETFPNLTMLVIVVNALYIGIEADCNQPDASKAVHVVFDIFDNLFCLFFTTEWLIRFLAFIEKRDCLKDLWFRFDSILLLMMIWDTWIMPFTGLDNNNPTGATGLVKLLRLLRLARISRVVRALPELVAMIKGLKVASRAVGAALFMLVMLIYVCSIALFTLLKDSTQDFLKSRFDGLTTVMWTVLIDGTFLDNVGLVVRNLQEEDEKLALFTFIIFVLASALTVMNMLIGVLCEVVTSVAAAEKDNAAVRLVKAQLLGLLKELDEDGSGLISREEIGQVLHHEAAMTVLKDLRVDEASLLAILDMYYDQADDLSMNQIMELILMLRGDTPATMTHILQSQQFLQYQFQSALAALTYRST